MTELQDQWIDKRLAENNRPPLCIRCDELTKTNRGANLLWPTFNEVETFLRFGQHLATVVCLPIPPTEV